MRTNKKIILCLLLIFDIVVFGLWFLRDNGGSGSSASGTDSGGKDLSVSESIVTDDVTSTGSSSKSIFTGNEEATGNEETPGNEDSPGEKKSEQADSDDQEMDSEQILKQIRDADVGDIVSLGEFDQDGNEEDGDEDIEWIVLDKNDSASLLLSQYALQGMQYNNSRSSITWEDCSLRSWLNGEFYDTCFSDNEKEFILDATIPADSNPDYDTDCGNVTTDKVFLLSYLEANTYFDNDAVRRCQTTDHAVNSGVLFNQDYGTTWWWLRTAGETRDQTAIVNSDGSITSNGLVIGIGAVRPAMWVRNNDNTRLKKLTIATDND